MRILTLLAALVAATPAFADHGQRGIDVPWHLGVGAGARTAGDSDTVAAISAGFGWPTTASTAVIADFRALIGNAAVGTDVVLSDLYTGLSAESLPVRGRLFARGGLGITRLAIHDRRKDKTTETDWGAAAILEGGIVIARIGERQRMGTGALALKLTLLPAYYGERGANVSIALSLEVIAW